MRDARLTGEGVEARRWTTVGTDDRFDRFDQFDRALVGLVTVSDRLARCLFFFLAMLVRCDQGELYG